MNRFRVLMLHVCSRGMLAERLLAKTSYDHETEIRTLEHLKMRFGESNLHNCEVTASLVFHSMQCHASRPAMP